MRRKINMLVMCNVGRFPAVCEPDYGFYEYALIDRLVAAGCIGIYVQMRLNFPYPLVYIGMNTPPSKVYLIRYVRWKTLLLEYFLLPWQACVFGSALRRSILIGLRTLPLVSAL